MSLAYNLGTEDEDGLLVVNRAVPPCDEIGTLEIMWEPCVTELIDGVRVVKAGAEPDQIDDPAEMVGGEWAALLKIRKVHKLPFMLTKARVSYDFYNDTDCSTMTVEYEEGSQNPEWDYEKVHYVPNVTHEFLQWIQNAAVQFTICASPMVREHGSGAISTENPTVVEQTKAMMKLGKMDPSGNLQASYTSVTLPPIADKEVEKVTWHQVCTQGLSSCSAGMERACFGTHYSTAVRTSSNCETAERYFHILKNAPSIPLTQILQRGATTKVTLATPTVRRQSPTSWHWMQIKMATSQQVNFIVVCLTSASLKMTFQH